MSRRWLIVVVTLVAALAALALPAFGDGGPGQQGSPPPDCQAGQVPSPQAPCRPPECQPGQQPSPQAPCRQPGQGAQEPPDCAEGQVPTQESPCKLAPCAEGQKPSPDKPCRPQGGGGPGQGPGGGQGQGPGGGQGQGPGGGQGQGPGQGQGGQGGPPLKGGFLNKVWRFTADADSYDAEANVLNCTVTKILNLPKKFQDQDDDIVDSDAFVLFSKTTKVYGADGKRVKAENAYDGVLDDAETVKVVGKILQPVKWQKDQDGTPTPTIRAKKVYITG